MLYELIQSFTFTRECLNGEEALSQLFAKRGLIETFLLERGA